MESEQKNTDYEIIISQLKIARFFGHNLLVLKDNFGKVISEIDGLATSKKGEVKPVGYLPSDRLKAYVFKSPYLYENSQRQISLIVANEQVALHKWNSAIRAVKLINTKNLPYPILGIGKNSNSVISTLIRCMNLSEPRIPGGAMAPFSGKMVLSESEIKKIQDESVFESVV